MENLNRLAPPAEQTNEPAVSVEAVLQHLENLAAVQPELASGCAYYQKLLPILIQARAAVPPLAVKPEHAQRKVETGLFIMQAQAFDLPPAATLPLFMKILTVVSGKSHRLYPRDQAALGEALSGALQGDFACRQSLSAFFCLPGITIEAAVQDTLKPFFSVWQAQLITGLDFTKWTKGVCPFCGSPPLLAELRGPQRVRRLRCGQCGADWPFIRLQCASCGTFDAHELGLLQPDGGAGRFSVQTCGACQAYVKQMVTTAPIPADLLIAEDLATLSLDLIAARRGFHRV